MAPLSLLITVGSTLFPALTDLILSTAVLRLLPSLGVATLVVQYGRARIPLFSGALEGMEVDAHGAGTVRLRGRYGAGAGGAGGGEPDLQVRVLRYTDDFLGLVEAADCVISHAGSGSILTTLRSRPPKTPVGGPQHIADG